MNIHKEKKFGRSGLKLDQITAINEALEEVNGRAWAHTASSACYLVSAAAKAEAELERINLPVSSRPGATAIYTTGGGRKYSKWSGAAGGTHATLKRFPDGWRVMSVAGITVYGGQASRVTVSISESQREAAERAVFKGISISRAA